LHQAIVYKIAAKGCCIQVEAAQNGIDFLLRVVRVELERLDHVIQDDQQLVRLLQSAARLRDLSECPIRVEEAP
jgi:hypothetical protein